MSALVVVSDEGQIIWPNCHDASLRGLLFSEKRLLISVKESEGATFCFVLAEVERMRADDFRQGNTILDVTISSEQDIDINDIAFAYGLEPKTNPFLLQTKDRLIRDKKLILKINPSYGGVVVCICESVVVDDDLLPL